MEDKPLTERLLEQLRRGTAELELVTPSIPSTPAPALPRFPSPFLCGSSSRFFARIGWSSGGAASPALQKVESFSVQKITGDGRCMFRALVRGMAMNKGMPLSPREERDDADELRMAVKEVICESDEERRQHEGALVAITVEESLKRYCQRIDTSNFWGGESELLVLSKLCRQPIIVYIPEHEHAGGGRSASFIPIAEYGSEFSKASKNGKPRKAVRLLFSGKNHYDLLI
ncbi:hypothetical protein Syun_000375 [Stephania yunnanensis]|uniref:Ubiquitin thioesterase OTU n=1 Tax=Stephania yunnanensis TaxID=152371 RepID=A0AAP0Q5I3_9MAGN